MTKVQFPLAYIKLIKTYFTGRSFTVKIQKNFSGKIPTQAGVPQSLILRPIIYSSYTYDIPKTEKTQIAIYVDDGALIAQTNHESGIAKKLQTHLKKIAIWSEK